MIDVVRDSEIVNCSVGSRVMAEKPLALLDQTLPTEHFSISEPPNLILFSSGGLIVGFLGSKIVKYSVEHLDEQILQLGNINKERKN